MKQILFLRESTNNLGGIEKQVCLIAKELYQKRISNPVLATSSVKSNFAERFKEMGFPVYEVPMNRTGIISCANKVDKIIKNHKIDIIQSHMFFESFIGRLAHFRHPGIKHVFRAHTYIDCSWIPRWKKNLYHLVDKLTSNYVDRYVCISHDIHSELISKSLIPDKKISILPNATLKIGDPDAEVNNLGVFLPAKIAMISNISPHKGHEVIIRSLGILKNKGISVNVRFIGKFTTEDKNDLSNNLMNKLTNQAGKLGVLTQLDFFGFTNDIYKAIKDYPIIILPSDSEGLPNCILEALSLRKLVIASKVGGVPEIINNGVNGILHAPQDSPALASILEDIFRNPAYKWEPIRNNGYRTWLEKFTVDRMIDGFNEIYNCL